MILPPLRSRHTFGKSSVWRGTGSAPTLQPMPRIHWSVWLVATCLFYGIIRESSPETLRWLGVVLGSILGGVVILLGVVYLVVRVVRLAWGENRHRLLIHRRTERGSL